MKFYIIYIFVVLTFTSCLNKNEETIESINVPSRIDTGVSLAKLSKLIAVIPLETQTKSFLFGVSNIKFHDEKLYISDSKKILVFDIHGEFLYQLGRNGDGPGEYKYITSMEIDKENNIIYISSNRKLLVYNTENEFLEQKTMSVNLDYLKKIDGKLFAVSQSYGEKVENGFLNHTILYEIDSLFKIVDTIAIRSVKLKEYKASLYPYKYFFSTFNGDSFLYAPVNTDENLLRDTLYAFKSNSLIPYLKLNFEIEQSLDNNGVRLISIRNIINSEFYLISEYFMNGNNYLFIYDKSRNINFNLKNGILDIDGKDVYLRPLDLENNLFYYVKTQEFTSLGDEEMNPIIGIVELN